MMRRSTVLIFWILVPSLLARTVNFDQNVVDNDLDNKIMKKHVPEMCHTEESVKLSDLQLTDVPKQAVRSRAIRSIALDNNLISNVPVDIFEDVPNLQCLNLARNKILFWQLLNFKHEGLKVLIVNHQDPEPPEFYREPLNDVMLETSKAHFPNLESLHLNGVNFEFFHPDFNLSFPRLKTLYMTENGLTYMDRYMMSRLPGSLKNLHLEKNKFESITLEYVGNLEELYLDENPLVSLKLHHSMNALKRLSLSKCSLQDGVGDLLLSTYFPFLAALDLSHNKIHQLPQSTFQYMQSLEALSISHNELATLPDIGHLTKLRRLSLSHNSIDALSVAYPILPSSLQILSLRGNRIRSIDSDFFQHLELEELDLSVNMLRSLPRGWDKGMKELRYLNLKSNQFASIGDMMVSSLLSLNELRIKDNVLKTIDENSLELVPSHCTVYVI
ncbi:podocan-like protein 1 [Andrena cerasifolii]|uniref:podocan-like protein 1 n=1 Tax=Andrena cerasifolii TaxID=2819439 RepID=UPI004038356E